MYSPLTFLMEAAGDMKPGPPPSHIHDFLDDLESFFWVYVTAISIFDGPFSTRQILSNPDSLTLPAWHKATGIRQLLDIKEATIFKFYEYVPSPYFSRPPYTTLLANLRLFFKSYHEQMICPPEVTGVDTPEDRWLDMDEIYNTVLGYFDSAIEDLRKAPVVKKTNPTRPVHRRKRPLDDASPEPQPSKKARGDQPRAAPRKRAGRKQNATMGPPSTPPPANVRRSQRLKERSAKSG